MSQLKYRPLARRQLFERASNARSPFACHRAAFRVVGLLDVNQPAQEVDVARVRAAVEAHRFMVMPTPSKIIEAAVRHYAIDPGVKGTFKSKTGEIPVGA